MLSAMACTEHSRSAGIQRRNRLRTTGRHCTSVRQNGQSSISFDVI
jgi:hypothetical protein